jgi:hypothetical protein
MGIEPHLLPWIYLQAVARLLNFDALLYIVTGFLGNLIPL